MNEPYENSEAVIQAIRRFLKTTPAQIFPVSLGNHHEQIVVTARIGPPPDELNYESYEAEKQPKEPSMGSISVRPLAIVRSN
jgi:hypothetical protein